MGYAIAPYPCAEGCAIMLHRSHGGLCARGMCDKAFVGYEPSGVSKGGRAQFDEHHMRAFEVAVHVGSFAPWTQVVASIV